jgi:hypothetical protein
MHRPEPHPAHADFSAVEFVASCGWSYPHHDPDRMVSAAKVGAELARWCQLTAMVSGRRALPDRVRLAQVLTAMQATALASTRLLEFLADDVDPHTVDPHTVDPHAADPHSTAPHAGDTVAPSPERAEPPAHPSRTDDPRIFRHEPGENAEVLTELAAMAAAENLRDAMLLTRGLSYSLGRALEHLDRSEHPSGG